LVTKRGATPVPRAWRGAVPCDQHGARSVNCKAPGPVVIQRVEPPPGICLGRPVKRMLQGTGPVELFAAFDIATGLVIAKTYKCHRAKDWIKFLEEIDDQASSWQNHAKRAADRMCFRSTS
jgi:hypothetical protein